jgi:hypothetical protein
MMRRLLVLSACIALTACAPGDTKKVETAHPDATATTPVWTRTGDAAQVTLSIKETADMEPFTLRCAKAGPALTVSAGVQQVAIANLAAPYALVLSGGAFPASQRPELADAKTFSVTAPVTPELLSAIRDTSSARISVNGGYAFAESATEAGSAFETFARDCASLTGVVAIGSAN